MTGPKKSRPGTERPDGNALELPDKITLPQIRAIKQAGRAGADIVIDDRGWIHSVPPYIPTHRSVRIAHAYIGALLWNVSRSLAAAWEAGTLDNDGAGIVAAWILDTAGRKAVYDE